MKKNKKDIKISACMMVKNEEEMLPRCLNSIKHLIDELIVVDTGSTDKTIEIAESFGAKIYHHPWENNFSKHRNQSLGYATGDWILLVDADEELNAYHLKKNDLKKNLKKAPKALHCYLIKVLDKNKGGQITSATESIRIFRNNVGIQYKGIVHNKLHYSGKVSHMDLQLFHYGYALSDSQMQAKYKRTSGLLFKRIEEDPGDYDAYFYLYQVHSEMGEKEQAVQYAQRCLELIDQEDLHSTEASFYYSLYYGIANISLKSGKYDQALSFIRKGLEVLPDEVDLYYVLAATGYFSGQSNLAIEGGENYFRVLDEFRSNPARSGTRFIFTTSKQAELSVCFWLMTGLIAAGRFSEFLDLWKKYKEEMLEKPGFQKELFNLLEKKDASECLEPIAAFLLNHSEKIPAENYTKALSFLLFDLKETIIYQKSKNDAELKTMFEGLVSRYLDSAESYNAISTQDAVIIAEFLLNKNMGKFFLDLTLVLFERELVGQIENIDSKEVVAHGYHLIGENQPEDRKGQLVSKLCKNIAQLVVEERDTQESGDRKADSIVEDETSVPQKEMSENVFRSAFLEVDITPKVSGNQPVSLQGMAGQERRATKIASPLKMQILLIEDQNATKLLVVSADIFGFGNPMVNQIRAHAANWGIPPEGIVLNASHTHYAPGTMPHVSRSLGPYNKGYAGEVAAVVNNSLTTLYENLEPAVIYCGNADGVDIGINRRMKVNGQVKFHPNEKGSYDRLTPFLLLEGLSTRKRTLLINHGCHPTGLGNEVVVSADFPGYLRDELINTGKVDQVMYLQGAAGDIKESASDSQGRSKIFSSTVDDGINNAKQAADVILSALEPDALERLDESSISSTRETMYLPLKKLPDKEKIEFLKTDKNTDPVIREWASRLSAAYPSGRYPNALALDVQVVKLGGIVTWITFPAEPVTELGMKLKKTMRFPKTTFVLGYTNGLICYLPDDKIIEEGGYEADVSAYFYMIPYLLATGTESRVLSAVSNCHSLLSEKQSTAVYGLYHSAGRDAGGAFFTLSAGRCGTKSLAHMLDIASNAKVWHHPMPFLINETFDAYCDIGDLDKKQEVFWKARGQFIYKTWSQGLIHGETDHNMTPFCDAIAKSITNSKFIVLIRNPWEFVRSGMRRNYYNGHPWDSGRLKPTNGHKDFSNWKGMDQFEKVCWLWNETYTFILDQIEKIDPKRVFILKFEDLIHDWDKLEALFSFLEFKDVSRTAVENVLKRKLNAQENGFFALPENWGHEKKTLLWDICGATAEQFGYTNNWEPSKNAQIELPDQHNNLDGLPGKAEKLLFIELPGTSTGGHLDHIVEHLNQDPQYIVRYEKTADEKQVAELIGWADIVWLEWANQMAVHVTNKIPEIKDKQVLCRLHGYEVFTDLPAQINWSVVDKLIFVAGHKKEIFNKKFKVNAPSQVVLRNGVNMEKFSIAPNKKNTKKLVLLGHINFRKGLPLLIQFFHSLLQKDPEYYLYIRGEFQDPKLEMAARTMIKELALENHIEFVEWVDDLNSWLADKSHILSFSLEESFHYAIGNGMAAGLKPVIHAWNESRDIWPEEFIFKSYDEFEHLISAQQSWTPECYRNLLYEYQLDSSFQLLKVEALLKDKDPDQVIASVPPPQSRVAPVPKKGGPKKHLVIIGLKRSGTTIFWETFRQDKRILCFDEPFRPHLRDYVNKSLNDKKETMDEYLARSEIIESCWSSIQPYEELLPKFLGHQEEYLKRLFSCAPYICADFVRCHSKLTHFKKILPEAFILHLVRDPRAFVTSHLKPYGKWISSDLPDKFFNFDGWFDFWQYQTLAKVMKFEGSAHEQLLQVWNYMTLQAEGQHPDLTISFERFATDPEMVIKSVYNHLSLDYQPLDFSGIHKPNPPFEHDHQAWKKSLAKLGIPSDRLYAHF